MLLTVNKTNEVITGVIGSEKYSIPYEADIFIELQELEDDFSEAEDMDAAKEIIEYAVELIKSGKTAAVTAAYGEYLQQDLKTNKFYLKSKGKVSSVPLPKILVDKIIEATDKGYSYLPFIKAWMWFLKNPRFTERKADYFAKYITTLFVDQEEVKKNLEAGFTQEKAVEMATYNDVAITKNGLLSTYKYVSIKYNKFDTETGDQVNRYAVSYDEETGRETIQLPENAEDYTLIPPMMGEGGDAFYAGSDLGHHVKVGAIHTLPEWSMVNCTDGIACVPGLHLGGRRYIQGYGGRTNLLLNCFVNPMHIGAFTDSGDGAIRVKEYFVHSAEFAPNKSFYNESTYLEHTQAQWADMLAEAVAVSEQKIKDIQNLQEELRAL